MLVALAPTLLCLTPLGRQIVTSAANERIDGTVEVTSVTFGWLSPVKIRGLTVNDKLGNIVGTVESLTVGKSLLGLLSNSSDLGTITVEKPQLFDCCTCRWKQSGRLACAVAQPAGYGRRDCRGDRGARRISQARRWLDRSIVGLRATRSSCGVTARFGIDLESTLQTKLGSSALAVDIVHAVAQSAGTQPAGTQLSVEVDRFPLEPLQPILTRLLGPVRLAGLVTGKLGAEMLADGKQQKINLENVEASQVVIASQRYLGNDTLQLEQVRANGNAQLADGVWQLRGLNLQSDVGGLSGSGDVRVSDFVASGGVPQSDCDIRGRVDLARLLKLLPETLHVRPEVQLTSGDATVELVSRSVGAGRRYTASLITENVQAVNQGQKVALREPIHISAAVLQTSQGWQIENVDAKSSFLTIDAAGTPAQGKVTLRGDMNKLAAELDQFIDLGETRLAGDLQGAVQWQPDQGNALAVSGQLNLRAFELAAPGVVPWREDDLVVAFQGRDVSWTTASYGVARDGSRCHRPMIDWMWYWNKGSRP